MARITIVGLMLFLWLATTSLASSPDLHRALHADAHELSHECLVTAFTKGQFLLACEHVAMVVAVFSFSAPGFRPADPFEGPLDLRLGPSRAPPLHSFFTSVR